MDYRPNVDAMLWFAETILPMVQEEVPDVSLYIVGQKPHSRLDALRDNPAINLTGWVQSVKPYLHAADVYIAPLRMGSGTRLKLLEAMASRCAIVATRVAATGLTPEAQKTMIINDSPEMTARAIIHLLHNPRQREQLGTAAFEQVSRHYDWSVLVPGMLTAYKEIGLG
jgi:glycosyltransferase involved in cell wall biosynthesis